MRGGRVEPAVGGLDRQAAAAGLHRVAGVDAQVEQRILQLRRIDPGGPQRVVAPHFQHHRRAYGAADQLLHSVDQPAHVDRLGIERLPARERQQPVGEGGRPADRLLPQGDVAPGPFGAARSEPGLQHLQAGPDGGQQVVEIVRDAAGELADRLHLLALAQLLFGPAQRFGLRLDLRHVAAGRDQYAVARAGAPRDPAVAAVPVQVAVLDHRNARVGRQGLGAGPAERDVVGMDQVEQRAADEFGLGPAQHPFPGRVGGQDLAVEAGHQHQVVRQLPEAVAVGGPGLHLPLQRTVDRLELGDGLRGGDRRPGAVGHAAHEGDVVGRPGARCVVVQQEQAGQGAVAHQGHVEQGPDAQVPQPVGLAGGARVVHHVGDRDHLAAAQVLDEGAEVREAVAAGHRVRVGVSVPVALDIGMLLCRVDCAVARPHRTDGAAADVGRDRHDVGGIVQAAQAVAQRQQCALADFGLLARLDVDQHAGKAHRVARGVQHHRAVGLDPAVLPVGLPHPVFGAVGAAMRQGLRHPSLHLGPVLGVDRLQHVGQRHAGVEPVGVERKTLREAAVAGEPVVRHVPEPGAGHRARIQRQLQPFLGAGDGERRGADVQVGHAVRGGARRWKAVEGGGAGVRRRSGCARDSPGFDAVAQTGRRHRPPRRGYSAATAAFTSSAPSSSVSTTGGRPGACSR